MIILVAGAAAALQIPSNLIRTQDYPQWALQDEASAAAIVRYVVDPKGSVVTCTTSKSFGNARLSNELCALIRRRRLPSATSRDGASIHVVGEGLISLFLPFSKQGRQIASLVEIPDAELSVKSIAGGETANVRVILHFDRAGKVVDCGPASTERQADFVTAACGQKQMFDGKVERDQAGLAIPYLTTKQVRFAIAADPTATSAR